MPQIIVEKQIDPITLQEITVKMCPVGYIYCLYFKPTNTPFYIGQTKNVEKRYNEHIENVVMNYDLLVYNHIRTLIWNSFGDTRDTESVKSLITIRTLKCVDIDVLDDTERKYIKYCINRGLDIYNSCSFSVRYRKYGDSHVAGLTEYQKGCRCLDCKEAIKLYRQQYRDRTYTSPIQKQIKKLKTQSKK